MDTAPARARVQITPIESDDAATVRRWLGHFLRNHNRSWVRARGLEWSDAEVDAQLYATDLVSDHWSYIVRSAHNERQFVRVARQDGRLVGGVWAAEKVDDYLRTPTGVLNWIYVDDRARGLGVGKALMRAATDWMAGRDLRSVVVSVLADNEPAQRLYRSAGLDVADVRMMGPLRVREELPVG